MADLKWKTGITEVTETKINIRGYPVQELMGKISFAQAAWLVLMGELPDEKTAKIIDAIIVATIDHSAAPPSCIAARTIASTGASLSTSVGAGIQSMNRHHGGATEGCCLVLREAIEIANKENLSLDAAAEKVIADYKDRKELIPGFGHLLHKLDPRTVRLFEIVDELDASGEHVRMARAFERAFEKSGKTLPLNINGAVGAVLGDLSIPPEMMNGFFMISRVPGLIAHVLEEQRTMKPMRKIHPTEYCYNGPSERRL